MDQGAKTIRQVEDGFEVEEEMGLVVLVMFPRDDDHMLRGERERDLPCVFTHYFFLG